MSALTHTIIVFSLMLLVSLAAWSDLRTKKIPNQLLITGFISGLTLSAIASGTDGIVTSLAGFALGFLILIPGYLLHFTGAGDVKLVATLGVFSGPFVLLQIFFASVLVGAGFVLLIALHNLIQNGASDFYIRWKNMLTTLLRTGQFNYVSGSTTSVMKQRIPMAPFYAIGSSIVLGFTAI